MDNQTKRFYIIYANDIIRLWPDAFLTDEVSNLLKRHGKSYTLLKIDDVNNIGSLKLRVRSTLESIKIGKSHFHSSIKPFTDTPVYGKERKNQKMVAPFFTPFISPLIPDFMRLSDMIWIFCR